MKNAIRILAVLLCVGILSILCACGDKNGTEQEKNTSASTVSGNASGSVGSTAQENSSGIILPEDGKIHFGTGSQSTEAAASDAENTSPAESSASASSGEAVTGSSSAATSKSFTIAGTTAVSSSAATSAQSGNGTATGGSSSAETTSASGTDSTAASSSAASPSDDRGWGKIQWN